MGRPRKAVALADLPGLVSLPLALAFLGVPRDAGYSWANSGDERLGAIKVGSRFYIPRGRLAALAGETPPAHQE